MVRTCGQAGSSPSGRLGPERQTQAKRNKKVLLEKLDQKAEDGVGWGRGRGGAAEAGPEEAGQLTWAESLAVEKKPSELVATSWKHSRTRVKSPATKQK